MINQNYYGSQLPAPSNTQGSYNWSNGFNGSDMGNDIGGLLSSFFSKNPYAAGEQSLNNIPGLIKGALNPYMQQGLQVMGPLRDQLMNLMQNPAGFMQQIGSHYQQSPGYQFQVNQATDAANRAAMAGGMGGSAATQAQVAGLTNNLANQDYQQYLNNTMGAFNTGLQGVGGLEQQGFGASEDYASAMGDYYAQQAQMREAEAQRQNQQKSGMFSGLGSILGSLAGFL